MKVPKASRQIDESEKPAKMAGNIFGTSPCPSKKKRLTHAEDPAALKGEEPASVTNRQTLERKRKLCHTRPDCLRLLLQCQRGMEKALTSFRILPHFFCVSHLSPVWNPPVFWQICDFFLKKTPNYYLVLEKTIGGMLRGREAASAPRG